MKPEAHVDRVLEGTPAWDLVQRIAKSSGFVRSPRLTALLLYLADRKLRGKLDDLSETLIAIYVFERPADYNPAEDSIVRTQARLLRQKLEAYFQGEGSGEELILEIPKGGYVPTFVSRREPAPPAPVRSRSFLASLLAAGALLPVLVFAAGIWAGTQWFAVRAAPVRGSRLVNTFWKGVFDKENSVVLSYTNSVFLTTEVGDLLRFRGGAVADRGALVGKEDSSATALNPDLARKAGPVYYEDGFAGIGEVLAVHDLTRVLSSLAIDVILKRNRVVTADDLRNHDLIFLGSQALADKNFPHRFAFEWPREPPYVWRGSIVDTAAGSSAARSFQVERDPSSGVIRADYAIFEVVPGLTPSRRTVVLAGLTTSGTQGAAEFATTESGLRQVLRALGIQRGSAQVLPPYFECLLRVESAKGLDVVKVKYVAGSIVRPAE